MKMHPSILQLPVNLPLRLSSCGSELHVVSLVDATVLGQHDAFLINVEVCRVRNGCIRCSLTTKGVDTEMTWQPKQWAVGPSGWQTQLLIIYGNKLRVFESRVSGRTFGPKRDGVTGGWRKLHNDELHNLYSSPSIIRIIKSRRMRWAGHVARMGEKGNV
jgi:hypothetical protein